MEEFAKPSSDALKVIEELFLTKRQEDIALYNAKLSDNLFHNAAPEYLPVFIAKGAISEPEGGEVILKSVISGDSPREALLGTPGNIVNTFSIQSVSPELTILYADANNAALFKDIPIDDVYLTNKASFTRAIGTGTYGDMGFIADGEIPNARDASYVALQEVMRIIADLTQTGYFSQSDGLIDKTNALEKQREVSMVSMFQKFSTFFANATGFNPKSFRSIFEQHSGISNGFNGAQGTPFDMWGGTYQSYVDSGYYIDMKGAAINTATVNTAVDRIVTGGNGMAGMIKAFTPMGVWTAYNNEVTPVANTRIVLSENGQTLVTGNKVVGQQTTFGGYVPVLADNFMRRTDPASREFITTATGATGKTPPATPSGSIATVTDTTANYGTTQAGSYYYGIAVGNANGISAMALLTPSAPLAVAATQAVQITPTSTGGTFYVLYRSKKTTASGAPSADTNFYPVLVCSTSITSGFDGGAANTIRDRGRKIPGTYDAFIVENISTTISRGEKTFLKGILEILLPVGQSGFLGVTTMYAHLFTPLLKKPKGMVVIANCLGSDVSITV